MNKNCPVIVTGTGFFMLVLGVACSWYIFPKIIEHQIHKQIALKEGTQAYSQWTKQSFPLKFKVHFFNVSNPKEVQNGAKPIVTDVGPFIYDEYREKRIINVNEEEDTIEYVVKKTYFFNQKESGCRNDEDVVVILNAALVGIALQVNMLLPSAMGMVSEAMPFLYPDAHDIFLRVKAKDILFDGISIQCGDPEVEFICTAMKGALPPTMRAHPNGKDYVFSMFGHLNGTDDGPYVIGRGLKNTTRGDISRWKGDPQLSEWNGDTCNQINGTDSTLFHTMDKPDPRMYSFAQDFCRSMYASFDEETTFKGIKVYKYVSKKESIENNEENRCFCPVSKDEAGNDIYECPANGLVNIMPCVQAPILVSYPHFYLADEHLLDYVIGVKPDPAIHGSFAYFEPKTATPLSGMKRIQMNIKIERLETFELLANVTDGVFPMLWLEEGVDLPDDIVELLQSSFSKMKILDVVKWVFTVTGIVLMICSFVFVLQKEKLMCFSKVGSVDLGGAPKRVQNINISTIGDSQNNYPAALYPQTENKNVHDNHKRSGGNAQQEAWQFKL